MLTAAAGEASRADTRVAAALRIMALAPILAGSVLASRAVGDAMCCEVDIMEDNLLALDAQLTYTAYKAATQPSLGDGTVVGIATQIQLLIQV